MNKAVKWRRAKARDANYDERERWVATVAGCKLTCIRSRNGQGAWRSTLSNRQWTDGNTRFAQVWQRSKRSFADREMAQEYCERKARLYMQEIYVAARQMAEAFGVDLEDDDD